MSCRVISPVEITNKLLAMKRGAGVDAPIEEALWFLQYESTQPGGLDRLAKELVQMFPRRIGPEVVQAAYGRKRLSRSEAVTFWNAVPVRCRGKAFENTIPEAWILEASDDVSENVELFLEDLDEDGENSAWREGLQRQQARKRRQQERSKGLPEIELAALNVILAAFAESEIARALLDFCTIPTAGGIANCWAFPQLADSLQEFIAARAKTAQNAVAQTSVAKKVFEAMDFAWEEKVMVQVEGDPRHGKTLAISAYCAAHRGRVRLVTVPCENSDSDFFLAIAEGLGIEVVNPGNVAALRRQIDFVLTHARLMIIWDEAHWLLPQRYSESTPPSRMNWIRTRVADRGLPTALIITPQSFDEPLRKFIRKTKYRFEQFFGRLAPFKLPETLTREDVIAVAQFHFPEIPLPYLKMIAGRAMQCAGYLKAVEFTAKRARHLAKRAGRVGEIQEKDVLSAIEEMMPGKPDPTRAKKTCSEPATALHRGGNRAGTAVRSGAEEDISSEGRIDSPSRIAAEELAA